MLLSTISVHQIPALISFGITGQIGGIVVMMVTLVSVVGRLVGGFFGAGFRFGAVFGFLALFLVCAPFLSAGIAPA